MTVTPEKWMLDAGEYIARQWGLSGHGDPLLIAQVIQQHFLEPPKQTETQWAQGMLAVGALWMLLSADPRLEVKPLDGGRLLVKFKVPPFQGWEYTLTVRAEEEKF